MEVRSLHTLMKIELTQGKYALVDSEDINLVKQYKWHFVKHGYAESVTKGKHIYMHRLITNAPKGKEVDHINGDKLDNRKKNLRLVNHTVNMQNSLRKTNLSGFRGVRKNLVGWQAYIFLKNKFINLGNFRTPEEAFEARREGEIKYFGVNCRIA